MGDERDRRVALLRGINVGTANRIAMADLRALVEDLGYEEVQTWLASGNVVFTVPDGTAGDPAARIREALEDRLGVSCRVVALDREALGAAIEGNPLLDVADDPSRLLVSVLEGPEDVERVAPLVDEEWAPEALALGERVAYLWCPEGIHSSRLAKAVDHAVDGAVTSRNWRTLTRVAELLED